MSDEHSPPASSSAKPSDQAAAETPAVPAQPALDIRSATLNVLAALAVILVLQYAQSVLIPIVLGVLISYSLAPIVAALQRVHVARSIGAGIAVTLLVGALGLGTYTLSDQAMSIVSDVPAAAQRMRDRMRARRGGDGALQKVQKAATEIDKAAQEASAPGPA